MRSRKWMSCCPLTLDSVTTERHCNFVQFSEGRSGTVVLQLINIMLCSFPERQS